MNIESSACKRVSIPHGLCLWAQRLTWFMGHDLSQIILHSAASRILKRTIY